MLSIPVNTLQFYLMPLLSAQLLVLVLVYFSFVSRQVLKGFIFHACFLLSFAFFLLGKILQNYTDYHSAIVLLYLRVWLFFGLGLPSMILATALQSAVPLNRLWYVGAFVIGLATASFYVLVSDMAHYQLFIQPEHTLLHFMRVDDALAQRALMVNVILLNVIPCLYLVYRHISTGLYAAQSHRVKHNAVAVAFIAGTISFGVLLLLSYMLGERYWLYYVGSFFIAACWCWAVYSDIQGLKGRAQWLNDELQLLLTRGGRELSDATVRALLQELEHASNDRVDVYKLKVRECLSRLVGAGIDAGADVQTLLQRNTLYNQQIDSSDSAEAVRDLATKEALALSELIADLPQQRSAELVAEACVYIEGNYQGSCEVAAIAEYCGVSRSYLMRCFKKARGQTINQHLLDLRMQKAKALLLEQSITDTAFAVGFNDSNYFSNVFKRVTGLTPGQYQQQEHS